MYYSGTYAPGVGGGVVVGAPKNTAQPGLMNPTRSNVAKVVSIKLTPRAMSFAARWDVPTNQATTAPTSGTKMRRLRMYVISSTQPRPPTLEETQSEHERDDHDNPEDDDPRVALDLSGLSLPEPQTRPHGLEADCVHRPIDDFAVEPVGPRRDDDPGPAHAVHDPVVHLAVEPMERPGRAIDGRPSERRVRGVAARPFPERAV